MLDRDKGLLDRVIEFRELETIEVAIELPELAAVRIEPQELETEVQELGMGAIETELLDPAVAITESQEQEMQAQTEALEMEMPASETEVHHELVSEAVVTQERGDTAQGRPREGRSNKSHLHKGMRTGMDMKLTTIMTRDTGTHTQ